jgi:hypothetical protein
VSSTDSTKTPKQGTAHSHTLSATDKAIAALTARINAQDTKIATLEKDICAVADKVGA